MHAFFVVVRGHSDGKVLLERCGKRSTDTVSVRREAFTFIVRYVVKYWCEMRACDRAIHYHLRSTQYGVVKGLGGQRAKLIVVLQ